MSHSTATPQRHDELDIEVAESTYREINGVRLHVLTAGEPADPLVVLLHGFPEFWYGWREYIDAFVDAGYRVIVPDQRGYNRSEKPDGIGQYRLPKLSGDVAGLIESEGKASAHVVGHDWGATVAWDLALRRPTVLDRLGIINVPHPTVFQQTLRSNPRQLAKSWYMFYFQLPRLPEWVARRSEFRQWERAMREMANSGTFTDEEMQQYRTAWGRAGASRAMLNWYRALFRHREQPPRERVTAPTLIAWGEKDKALTAAMAPASVQFCDDGRLERFPDATHWVNHERSDRVSELMIGHFDDA